MKRLPLGPQLAVVVQLKEAGFSAVPEFRFSPGRRWRFDVALPSLKIAIEIDGGIWTQGRHTRGVGYLKDCEKLNAATAAGWSVFRLTPEQALEGNALILVKRLLAQWETKRREGTE